MPTFLNYISRSRMLVLDTKLAGTLYASLIGNDGVIRGNECCANFYAGPGLSSAVTVTFHTGHASNFTIMWANEDGNIELYKLPEGY